MQMIPPFFWLNGQAEEAVVFYLPAFNQAPHTAPTHYGKEGPGTPSVVTALMTTRKLDLAKLEQGYSAERV